MHRDARFPTTQWSLVFAAAQPESTSERAALASLCCRYWYPVFAFVRREGHSADEAQDLTQSFFTRLIEKGDLGDADRDRGRFRTFLLAACRHFLANASRRARARKRGGGQVAITIDAAAAEARYQRSLADSQTPERLYERQWCLTLLDSVLEDVRARYAAAGNEHVFERLRGFITGSDSEGTLAAAGFDLGISSGAAKVAVHRLRRRYRDALRQRVADTVASAEDVDDEIRALLSGL